jgi:4-amino-4-deoxy-L-arabinose transferase-like glycosyltransferase
MNADNKFKNLCSLAIIIGCILLLRLPFLNQAIQGDDAYYLAAAQYAQIDPAHPNHAVITFLGKDVSLRGHPHPPLNGWVLGALLFVVGDIREVPFHAAYIVFSIIAGLSMWLLARRFSPQPLWATLLFLVAPAFVVNGNSLEADIPFLAFWMASIALFVRAVDTASWKWLAGSIMCMCVAAMAAMQAIFLVPILAVYLWTKRRGWKPAWIALFAVPFALAVWQLTEKLSAGALPASELAQHFQTYNLQSLQAKLKNAIALTVHAGWIVFPPLVWWAFRNVGKIGWALAAIAALGGMFYDPNPLFWLCFATGALVLCWCVRNWRSFEAAWILLFFAGALVVFFAGSARYLLPIAAPLAILVSRQGRWLPLGFAAQLLLALGLSIANYQHWDGYRQFVATLPAESDARRVWINGEWGLQYYAEARGGLALKEGQPVGPGEYVVSSELGYPIPYTTGGGLLTPLSNREVRSTLPFRLIALNSKSAYSTVAAGFRAFDISNEPIDRVHAGIVIERKPTLSDLPLNSAEAASHIVSGLYALENTTRWMSGRATVLLKRPTTTAVLRASIYIPDTAPARTITLYLDGKQVHSEIVKAPGMYQIKSAPIAPAAGTATVTVAVDKTFHVSTDRRELGAVLVRLGFE